MRRHAFEKDWTKGNIPSNLLSLSWPIVTTQSLNQVGPFIDMIWVGKLGAASIAGVGVSALAVQFIGAIMMGITTGMRAMIARFVGAGDTGGANHVAQQAFVVSASFAATVATIGIFTAKPILVMFGLEADVVAEGTAYLRIMFLGSAAMSFLTMAEGVMQASGDTVTPMRIAITYRLFHLVLAPFLIFGWWLFPRLGVSGAAAISVISQSLGLALASLVLFTGRTRLRPTLRNFRLDFPIIWRIVKIGLPATASQIERVFAHLILMRIVVPFGTFAVAAKSIFRQIETPLIVTPSAALGRGAGVLAAQNLGAGQPARAEKSGWLAAGFAEAFTISACIAILLWAEPMFGIFSRNPDVVKIASTFFRIATVGYLFLCLNQVMMNALLDVGDTIPPMLTNLIGMWLVEIPMAFFLSRLTDNVYMVQVGTVIGQFARGAGYLTYFKMGRWKEKRV